MPVKSLPSAHERLCKQAHTPLRAQEHTQVHEQLEVFVILLFSYPCQRRGYRLILPVLKSS